MKERPPEAPARRPTPPIRPDPKLLVVREDRGPRSVPLPEWLKRLAAKI